MEETKTLYHSRVRPNIELITLWVRRGESNAIIADKLGIGLRSLLRYKANYPELAKAMAQSKEIVDYQVENALLKNALSGNVTAQIYWLRNRQPRYWDDKVQEKDSSSDALDKLVNAINGLKGGDDGE